MKRLFSLKEAAIYLGRSDWSVRDMLWSGKLPYIKDGKKFYIDILDLEEWINRTKQTFGAK
jgi:excisionase family DNA binding protein